MGIFIVLCCILATLCILMGAYLILLKRDIGRMADTVQAVSATETNGEVYTLTGNKELRRLAVEINHMLGDFRQEKYRMQQADEAFKQSITGISHDLRTPLTSVTGYVQMLGSDKTTPEKKTEYLSIIEKRLEALLTLLDELFAYTRLESENRELEIERVNLGAVLLEQLAVYYEEFNRIDAEPQIKVPDYAVFMMADPKCLERVLQNLIKNMLVHGGGVFQISLEQQEEQAKLCFANNIKGELEHPERIFDRFYTGDRSRSNRTTGLGLAIVKQLVEAMQGSITARQEDGLLFITLIFPQK